MGQLGCQISTFDFQAHGKGNGKGKGKANGKGGFWIPEAVDKDPMFDDYGDGDVTCCTAWSCFCVGFICVCIGAILLTC